MQLQTLAAQEFDQATICAVTDQVSSDLGGESVILHLSAGTYYGLNEVGARIWSLIETPQRFQDVRDTICQEYEVETAVCEGDIANLLRDLSQVGLIEVHRNQAA
jgi:hypothetical protein